MLGKLAASVLAVAVVSALSLGAYAVFDLAKSANKSVHLVGEPKDPIPDIGTLKGGVNILITATDTRSGQGGVYGPVTDSSGEGNNDTTLLLHLAQDHSNMTVVSFPRDLMIPIPSCPIPGGGSTYAQSKQQINTTLATGGLACAVLTIQDLTGIKSIPFAGVLKFNGVVAMSNAIGGVPVCIGGKGIDDPLSDYLHLTPGVHPPQGQQAANFLRTRHGVGDGSDLGRISNQMVFFSALLRTIKSSGTLTNPAKVWGLAKVATQNVYLSDQLSKLTTMYQIAMAVKDINMNNVSFVQYPTLEDPDNSNRVVPYAAAASVLFDAIAKDQPITITGGTGNQGQGSIVETPSPASATSSTPTSGKTSTSKSSLSQPPAVKLPDSIHGQTAATETCASGLG